MAVKAATKTPVKKVPQDVTAKALSRPARTRPVARSDTSDEEVPTNRRLGFRASEYAKLLGLSYVSVWRAIKAGKIETIDVNGIQIIPRAFLIKSRLITVDDDI